MPDPTPRPAVRPATIRLRRDEDLPALVEVLARQQSVTRYPLRWPLPYDPVDFIRRPEELAAWVAEVEGKVVGHVAVRSVTPGDAARDLWMSAHGLPDDGLAVVSGLYVDLGQVGLGIGSMLLEKATRWATEQARELCLDVVRGNDRAAALYRRRGWEDVGETRPAWLPAGEPPVQVMVLRRVSEPSSLRRP